MSKGPTHVPTAIECLVLEFIQMKRAQFERRIDLKGYHQEAGPTLPVL
jgi:hypothetical protein